MTHALDAARAASEDGTRWCAGLPCVAEERLTEVQRTAAERVYKRSRNAMLAYAAIGTLVLPGALGACLWAAGRLGHHAWVTLAVAFTLFALLVPLCLVKAWDHGRTALPLQRDLEDGFLWVFEGHLAEARYEEEDPEVLSLLNAGLFVRGGQEQRICVLPRSGRLMQVNGKNLPAERRLHVSRTAAWPSTHSFRFSLPPEVKEVLGATARELKRRRMAEPERAELQRHVARLTALPWLLIGLTAVMSTFVSAWIVRDKTAPEDLLAVAWLGIWSYAALRHLRGYALARRLEADMEVGWLLSWETADDTQAAPPTPPDPRDERRPPFQHAEVLPVSQRDWMIDGKPAAWRRVLSRSA
ncbi:MAG TPA: hypothetical protein VJV78_32980 [Polyangiales bacterium]|nr:hypothetical protein [Polyangiales bacterium]